MAKSIGEIDMFLPSDLERKAADNFGQQLKMITERLRVWKKRQIGNFDSQGEDLSPLSSYEDIGSNYFRKKIKKVFGLSTSNPMLLSIDFGCTLYERITCTYITFGNKPKATAW